MDVLVNLSAINSHLYEAKPVARQHRLASLQPRQLCLIICIIYIHKCWVLLDVTQRVLHTPAKTETRFFKSLFDWIANTLRTILVQIVVIKVTPDALTPFITIMPRTGSCHLLALGTLWLLLRHSFHWASLYFHNYFSLGELFLCTSPTPLYWMQ